MEMMRYVSLIICLLCAVIIGKAESLPFLKDGNMWIIGVVDPILHAKDEVLGYSKIIVVGDDEHDNKSCKKLSVSQVEMRDGDWCEIYNPDETYDVWVTEENGVVRLWDASESIVDTSILPWHGYALSLDPNKMRGGYDPQYPYTKEYIIKGVRRKCLYYPNKKNIMIEKWWIVEGIGMNSDCILNNGWLTRPGPQYYGFIEEFYEDGELVFTRQDFQDLPIPDESLVRNLEDISQSDATAFDLLGRIVKNPTNAGLYISNGKKWIKH